MAISDFPQRCGKCLGYLTMPYNWSSTAQPIMCSCPKPINTLGKLAWECPRCKKINAPWKGTCDCTPPPLSSPVTSGTNPYNAGSIPLDNLPRFTNNNEV